MGNKKLVNHAEFVEKYKRGKYRVLVDQWKAGDFVLSEFADKHNKLAHHFWSWLGILLVFPVPIALLFYHWYWAVGSFVVGLVVVSESRKTARSFVVQNMVEDENFWQYVLLHNGAQILDESGNEIGSRWLEDMDNKFRE